LIRLNFPIDVGNKGNHPGARLMTVYSFTTFDVPGATGTDAWDANGEGWIVGAATLSGQSNGFIKEGGGWVTFGFPGNTGGTWALGINDARHISGYYLANGSYHGFLLGTSAGNVSFDDIFATNGTFAFGINSLDHVAGYFVNGSGTHGFIWLGSNVFLTLNDPLGAGGTYAYGINASDQVVGFYYDAGFRPHGYLYDKNTDSYITIDDPLGTRGTIAYGINDLAKSSAPISPATAPPIRFSIAAAFSPRSTTR
jgi:hypothetical protein